MLGREDFYKINQETLDKYYKEQDKSKKLYIYPKLNAIVTKTPSRRVKKYLYVEYGYNGSLLKRILAKIYTKVVINSFGLLSSKTCRINFDLSDNSLIYPCNKKIRIFDFDNGTVRVVPKHSFSDDGIKKEIEFRVSRKADFIPTVLSFDDGEYTEKIIDGCPLARIGERQEKYKAIAFDLWRNYNRSTENIIAREYAKRLRAKFEELACKCSVKSIDTTAVRELEELLYNTLSASDELIEVGLSHGDLQAGNIWVENGTDKIYIIDWESVGERSVNYDHAALFRGLRTSGGLVEIASGESATDAVILYEDLLFRIAELNSLPGDIGTKGFAEYIKTILRNIKNV